MQLTEVNAVGVWFDPCRNDKGLKKFHSDPASVCDLVAVQMPSLRPPLGPLSHHEGFWSTLSNQAFAAWASLVQRRLAQHGDLRAVLAQQAARAVLRVRQCLGLVKHCFLFIDR